MRAAWPSGAICRDTPLTLLTCALRRIAMRSTVPVTTVLLNLSIYTHVNYFYFCFYLCLYFYLFILLFCIFRKERWKMKRAPICHFCLLLQKKYQEKPTNIFLLVFNIKINTYILLNLSSLGTIRAWNAQTGVALRKLEAHSGPVHCILTTADWLWSAGADKSLLVWALSVCMHTHTRLNAHTTRTRTFTCIAGRCIDVSDKSLLVRALSYLHAHTYNSHTHTYNSHKLWFHYSHIIFCADRSGGERTSQRGPANDCAACAWHGTEALGCLHRHCGLSLQPPVESAHLTALCARSEFLQTETVREEEWKPSVFVLFSFQIRSNRRILINTETQSFTANRNRNKSSVLCLQR